jgi:hypothetical protein
VTYGNGKFAMEFSVLAISPLRERMLSTLIDELPQIPHVETFSIARINRA